MDDDGRAEALQQFLLEAISDKLTANDDERYSEYHLAELISGLRKGFYNRTQYLPPTKSEILNFTAGRAHEEILAAGIPAERRDVEVWKDDIVGHMDAITEDGLPIEFKTTRGSPKYGVNQIYDDQLMGYSLMNKTTEGFVTVLYLIQSEIKTYLRSYTPDDLEMSWRGITVSKNALEECLESGVAPDCPRHRWECVNRTGKCRYYKVCDSPKKTKG